ncbi:MAG: hypothetical protein WBJ37_03440 [Bacteroidales bacterium]
MRNKLEENLSLMVSNIIYEFRLTGIAIIIYLKQLNDYRLSSERFTGTMIPLCGNYRITR